MTIAGNPLTKPGCKKPESLGIHTFVEATLTKLRLPLFKDFGKRPILFHRTSILRDVVEWHLHHIYSAPKKLGNNVMASGSGLTSEMTRGLSRF